MNFEKISEDLYSVTNVLSTNNFLLVHEEFDSKYNSWIFDKKENNRPDWYPCRGYIEMAESECQSIGYNYQFIRIATIVKLHCENFLKKKLNLNRIHTNIQFFGQESTFHIDATRDIDIKFWSFLIFVNVDWNIEHGGDFICNLKNGQYKNIPFIPNNGALFNSKLPHRGAAPNSLCLYKPRKTIQFLFYEVDNISN